MPLACPQAFEVRSSMLIEAQYSELAQKRALFRPPSRRRRRSGVHIVPLDRVITAPPLAPAWITNPAKRSYSPPKVPFTLTSNVVCSLLLGSLPLVPQPSSKLSIIFSQFDTEQPLTMQLRRNHDGCLQISQRGLKYAIR